MESIGIMLAENETNALIARVDALLPQTQCTQCGYDGCKPYAEAIVIHGVPINQCPPGGEQGIRAMADFLKRDYLPLNPTHGVHRQKELAVIDESLCIGCTLCIQACPVDAIVGAAKQMHTVIATECTGCELCVAPCPVDCIEMQSVGDGNYWFMPLSDPDAAIVASRARVRHEARLERLKKGPQERTFKDMQTKEKIVAGSADAKRSALLAAMARAQTAK